MPCDTIAASPQLIPYFPEMVKQEQYSKSDLSTSSSSYAPTAPTLPGSKEASSSSAVQAALILSLQTTSSVRAEPNNLPYEQGAPVANTNTPANTRTVWELYLDTLNENDRKSQEKFLEESWSIMLSNRDSYDFLRTDTLKFMKSKIYLSSGPVRDELRRRFIDHRVN
ncbi:MAG: hypothetical protein BGO07_02660 [Alphaproteobacteria bacterium 40-19]|nr:MAG: hypothetical protein BGO07_02660 [Alphaproteobacteria bacterium 40-19]